MWTYVLSMLFVALLAGLVAVRVMGMGQPVRNMLTLLEREYQIGIWVKPVSAKFGDQAHIPGVTPNAILFLTPEGGEEEERVLVSIYHYAVREGRARARVERVRLEIAAGDPINPSILEITCSKRGDEVITCTGYEGRIPTLERDAALELARRIMHMSTHPNRSRVPDHEVH